MGYRDDVKQWFETLDTPSQSQFNQTFDYIRFKDEPLAISEVSNLASTLNNLGNTPPSSPAIGRISVTYTQLLALIATATLQQGRWYSFYHTQGTATGQVTLLAMDEDVVSRHGFFRQDTITDYWQCTFDFSINKLVSLEDKFGNIVRQTMLGFDNIAIFPWGTLNYINTVINYAEKCAFIFEAPTPEQRRNNIFVDKNCAFVDNSFIHVYSIIENVVIKNNSQLAIEGCHNQLLIKNICLSKTIINSNTIPQVLANNPFQILILNDSTLESFNYLSNNAVNGLQVIQSNIKLLEISQFNTLNNSYKFNKCIIDDCVINDQFNNDNYDLTAGSIVFENSNLNKVTFNLIGRHCLYLTNCNSQGLSTLTLNAVDYPFNIQQGFVFNNCLFNNCNLRYEDFSQGSSVDKLKSFTNVEFKRFLYIYNVPNFLANYCVFNCELTDPEDLNFSFFTTINCGSSIINGICQVNTKTNYVWNLQFVNNYINGELNYFYNDFTTGGTSPIFINHCTINALAQLLSDGYGSLNRIFIARGVLHAKNFNATSITLDSDDPITILTQDNNNVAKYTINAII